MKRPRQHKIIIRRHLQQTRLEFALVDQPAGFINDDQGEDGPGSLLARCPELPGGMEVWTYMMKKGRNDGRKADSECLSGGVIGVAAFLCD